MIQQLLSDDNDVRKAAEAQYAVAKKQALPQVLVEMSALIGNPSTDTPTRGAVGTFLRKLIFDLKPTDFMRVSQAVLVKTKANLLQGFQHETGANAVRQICACIATLAAAGQLCTHGWHLCPAYDPAKGAACGLPHPFIQCHLAGT